MSLGIYIDKVLKKTGYTIKFFFFCFFFYLHEGSATRVSMLGMLSREDMGCLIITS